MEERKAGRPKRPVVPDAEINPDEAIEFAAPDESSAESEDELARLQEEVNALRQENLTLARRVKITETELQQEALSAKAALNTMLKTWPGVDYAKPAWAISISKRNEANDELPYDGELVLVKSNGRAETITFKRGYCVTNDLELAHSVARLPLPCAIYQVN